MTPCESPCVNESNLDSSVYSLIVDSSDEDEIQFKTPPGAVRRRKTKSWERQGAAQFQKSAKIDFPPAVSNWPFCPKPWRNKVPISSVKFVEKNFGSFDSSLYRATAVIVTLFLRSFNMRTSISSAFCFLVCCGWLAHSPAALNVELIANLL